MTMRKRPLTLLSLLVILIFTAAFLFFNLRKTETVMLGNPESYIRHHELPDPQRTPGAVRTSTIREICFRSTRKVRHVTSATKREVYAEYGNPEGNHTGFCDNPEGCEVDHLISLELGGSNAPENLWPEPYEGVTWNARVKDRIENELHRQICNGEISPQSAQRKIAVNWISAYCDAFSNDPKCSQVR